jgi:hypothetical protein
LQVFAGDFLDELGIGFEGLDLLAEFGVLLVEAVEVLLYSLDFTLLMAHGDKSVRAKNIVNNQGENEQAKNSSPVLLNEACKSFSGFRVPQFFRTHSVASRANRAEAAALSAST